MTQRNTLPSTIQRTPRGGVAVVRAASRGLASILTSIAITTTITTTGTRQPGCDRA
ncbi:hypothetical protein [Marilutibacter spongiae]|uniref:Uncharacterized protein n=1 Tax=Marilutibacter spongiae TaxID=2025720 RepID=A0A7W3TNN9_9GAMM|nr:hypothetical protein [Lysobacter spongiae]MBB1061672.1 hypothetical protein [Lysobacter spongiae]